MPAEIQCMRLGPWSFIGWPGEAFVEFALQIKASHQNCSVISMANGELQGYLVTEEAMQKKWYEAMNSLFSSPQSGNTLVEKTLALLKAQGA
jgi:neutral ceramidase